MKQTVNFTDFVDAFARMGRGDQFSYKGKKALFEYLEQLEEDMGEEMELDVIALCCEYTEYENLEELKNDYSDIESMEELEQNTTVIMVTDESFIIQQY